METTESEQPQDDFDVKITNIDKPDDDLHASETSQPPSPRHFWAQWRWLQLAITVALAVLAVLIMLSTTAPMRDLVVGAFIHPGPMPTPTLASGLDLFYVQGDPAWGQLSIDGQAIARLPVIRTDPPLRLARGRHVLTWRAYPFVPQVCTVSVPFNFTAGTCLVNETVQLDSDISAWVIRFPVSLDALPDEQRATLVRATQAALDVQQSIDTVRPGELYVLSPQSPACHPARPQPVCYAVAREPLQARLSFQLDTNTRLDEACLSPETSGACTLSGRDCHLFCTSILSASSSGQEWDIVVPARVVWTFATASGQILEHDVSDNSLADYITGDPIDEVLVPLSIMWDGQNWQVTSRIGVRSVSFFDPICVLTERYAISPFLNTANINNTSASVQWQYASGARLATGCVAIGTLQQSQPLPPVPTPSLSMKPYCLHRFGVLLAANEVAERYWPGLPLADAYEQQVAKQLAAGIQ